MPIIHQGKSLRLSSMRSDASLKRAAVFASTSARSTSSPSTRTGRRPT